MILIMGEGLAKAGKISPFWGGWASNIFFGVTATLVFYIAYKDKPLKKL